MSLYNKISTSFNNFFNNKVYKEIYTFLIMFIALFGYRFNDVMGISILIFIILITLLFTNDFTNILAPSIFMLFVINDGFANNEIPLTLIILTSILVLILLIFIIRNGFKLKKMKSLYGLLGLAIANILPIFWANNINSENNVFYFFYFANLGYLILYVIFVNGLKKGDLNYLAVTMSYLGLLLTGECLYKVLELNIKPFIQDFWLGWGVCNEAGIMICFSLPFIFYLICNTKSLPYIFFNTLKIIIVALGVLLTTSRASYICILIGLPVLITVSLFFNKTKKAYGIYTLSICALTVIISLFFLPQIKTIINEIKNINFSNGLESNDRLLLYEEAINKFKENPLYMILGPGICTSIDYRNSGFGYQLVPIVYHSTFFETLIVGGIFGMLMLIIHLFQKYKNIAITKDKTKIFIILAYIGIDIYGLIDNTYHMYYYMIPLVIILAVIDNYNYYNKFD